MFVAITINHRYLGGAFGRIPSVRRTTRLKNPRGFVIPESPASSACNAIMSPPPPFRPPIIRPRFLGSSAGSSIVKCCCHRKACVGSDR